MWEIPQILPLRNTDLPQQKIERHVFSHDEAVGGINIDTLAFRGETVNDTSVLPLVLPQ